MRGSKEFPAEIEVLKNRIEKWRTTRSNGRIPMPERLWQSAARFAADLGVHAVATKLGLNAGRLKRRTEALEPGGEPAFIEVKPAAAASGVGPGLEVELTNRAGEKLVIRAAGAAVLDLPSLTTAFLSRQ